MDTFILILLIFAILLSSTYSTKSIVKEIFKARCHSRCILKHNNSSSSSFIACVEPCQDDSFGSVKSCAKFCSESRSHLLCRKSCKFLLNLYNKGHEADSCTSCVSVKPAHISISIAKRSRRSLIQNLIIRWNTTSPLSAIMQKKVVYIVQQRWQKQKPTDRGGTGKWLLANMTLKPELHVCNARTAIWHQFRVMTVLDVGSSPFTLSSFAYIPPNRPSAVRQFRVVRTTIVKGNAQVVLAWSKPENLDLPVHRYRVYWSRRIDGYSEELHFIREYHKRLMGNQHMTSINGLRMNTTYHIAIQVICHYQGKRLRSPRMELYMRTPEKEEPVIMAKPSKNAIEKPSQSSVPSKSSMSSTNRLKTKPTDKGGTISPEKENELGQRSRASPIRQGTRWLQFLVTCVALAMVTMVL